MARILRTVFAVMLLAGLGVFSVSGCNTSVDNTATTPEYDAVGSEERTDSQVNAPNPPPPDTP